MDNGAIKRSGAVQEHGTKKVIKVLSEYLIWSNKNGKSIDFLKSLKNRGVSSALDNMPIMDSEEIQLWNMFCAMDENVLSSLDIYEKRIGIPAEWEFKECFDLINLLKEKVNKLSKKNE